MQSNGEGVASGALSTKFFYDASDALDLARRVYSAVSSAFVRLTGFPVAFFSHGGGFNNGPCANSGASAWPA